MQFDDGVGDTDDVGLAVAVAVEIRVVVAVGLELGVVLALAVGVAADVWAGVIVGVTVHVRGGLGVDAVLGDVSAEASLVSWYDCDAETTVPSRRSSAVRSYLPGRTGRMLNLATVDASVGRKEEARTVCPSPLRIFSSNRYAWTGVPGGGWIAAATWTTCDLPGLNIPSDGYRTES